MEIKTKGKRALTEPERQAAARLKAEFIARKRQHGYTQETLGERLGWSQAAVNQYLNGINPIGLEALLAMCALIGADHHQIYPELASKLPDMPNDCSEFAQKLQKLTQDDQALIITMMDAMISRGR